MNFYMTDQAVEYIADHIGEDFETAQELLQNAVSMCVFDKHNQQPSIKDERDLFGKYYIQHTDGSPVDENAAYFVLRLDTDQHARKAVERYATSIFDENPLLAESLMNWMKEFK